MLWPSYLHNGISYTGKMASLYWIRAQVYIRAAYSLAPFITRSSAAMVLIMKHRQILVFPEEGFQWSPLSQCQEIIKCNYVCMFLQIPTGLKNRFNPSMSDQYPKSTLSSLLSDTEVNKLKHLKPESPTWYGAVASLLTNGSAAFKWKLHCHWLKGLHLCHLILLIHDLVH